MGSEMCIRDRKEIAQACKFAEESDYPDVSEAYKDVFVDIAASV